MAKHMTDTKTEDEAAWTYDGTLQEQYDEAMQIGEGVRVVLITTMREIRKGQPISNPVTSSRGAYDALRNLLDLGEAQSARIAELEALLAPKPDMNAKNGPCCYSLDKSCGRFLSDGCHCMNRDDAQQAAVWADDANKWIEQTSLRQALNTKDG